MRSTMAPRSELPDMKTWMPTKNAHAASNDAMSVPSRDPVRSAGSAPLWQRRQQLAAIEEDLVRVDASAAQLHGADAIDLDDSITGGDRRMPAVQEPIRQRQGTAV